MVKVIKEFPGVPDGQTRCRTFKPGDEVTGNLAAVAVKEGWAKPDSSGQEKPETDKAKAETATKKKAASRKPKSKAAPKNKTTAKDKT
jgi:hypothetical protein